MRTDCRETGAVVGKEQLSLICPGRDVWYHEAWTGMVKEWPCSSLDPSGPQSGLVRCRCSVTLFPNRTPKPRFGARPGPGFSTLGQEGLFALFRASPFRPGLQAGTRVRQVGPEVPRMQGGAPSQEPATLAGRASLHFMPSSPTASPPSCSAKASALSPLRAAVVSPLQQ